MRGGTDSERQIALAEAVALQSWFCFQRVSRSGLADVLASHVDRRSDTRLLYLLVDLIRDRDEQIMRDVYKELCDGFGGLIEPLRGGAVGVPWRTEPRGRNGETPYGAVGTD
jgi:hypothetical protein